MTTEIEPAAPALTLERRMTVKGWKIEGKRKEFSDTSTVFHESSIEYERRRIGEHVEHDWQPHITEVIVEYRWVTPWVEQWREHASDRPPGVSGPMSTTGQPGEPCG